MSLETSDIGNKQHWQTLLDTIRQEMDARYIHNLSLFKQYNFSLYNGLLHCVSQRSAINLTPGSVNITYNQQDLYLDDPAEIASTQVEAFVQRPDAMSFGFKPVSHTDSKQNQCLRRIEQYAKHTDGVFNNYRFDGKNMPVLIVYGIGMGFHLEELIKRLQIRHFIIYEPDIELLQASMHCIDWTPIFEYFNTPHKRIDIMIGTDIDKLCNSTLTVLRQHSPMYALTSFTFTHFSNEYINNFQSQLQPRLHTVLQGFGYYDDEKTGLLNTLDNISQQVPVLQNLKNKPIPYTAFIIGSGPSLNQSIETIKQHQANAIIFSCGTALGPLLKNGIVPDFHIEMERSVLTPNNLKGLECDELLQEIDFIGMNVIADGVYQFFNETFMAIKANDLGGQFFPENLPTLPFSNPSVANLGCSLALQLGLKSLYLFGVDMGSTNIDQHHAEHTIFTGENVDAERKSNNDQWWKNNLMKNTLPGNFNKTVYTSSVHYWAIENLSYLFQHFTDRNIFNCSDGAAIPFATPCPANNISLVDNIDSKNTAKEKIKAAFSRDCYQEMQARQTLTFIKEAFDQFNNHVNEVLKSPVKEKADIIKLFDQVFLTDLNNAQGVAAAKILARAATVLPMTYIYGLAYVNDKPETLSFIRNSLLELSRYISSISRDINAIYIKH